jgi:hypothetical protein
VTRPRAADDFATIRGRMEELCQVTRPRAADDFAVIRARMDELRRERAADPKGHSGVGPRPYHRAATGDAAHQSNRLLPRSVRWAASGRFVELLSAMSSTRTGGVRRIGTYRDGVERWG